MKLPCIEVILAYLPPFSQESDKSLILVECFCGLKMTETLQVDTKPSTGAIRREV